MDSGAADREDLRDKVVSAFRELDHSDSGVIPMSLLQGVLTSLGFPAEKAQPLFAAFCCASGSEGVAYPEFMDWLFCGAGAGTGADVSEEQRVKWLSKYTKIESVVDALASGDTVLIKGSWFVEFARSGKPLPKRQDLPREAVWDPEELGPLLLQNTDGSWEHWEIVPLALSYCWATPEHPDPTGEQTQRVANAVRAYTSGVRGTKCRDVALFIDWCSLYQEPRSPEEAASFKRGLRDVNLWYAHKEIVSLLLTIVPEGVRAYKERGWPSFEFAISGLAKMASKVLDASMGLPGPEDVFETTTDVYDQLVIPCKAKRPPPCTPESFNAKLETLVFTNGSDREFVRKKYRSTFEEVMGSLDELDFPRLDWSTEDCKELAAALPYCKSIRHLDVSYSMLGPEGVRLLAEAMPQCPSLRTVALGPVGMGYEGLQYLLPAVEQTPSVRDLWIMGNGLGDDAVELLLDFVAGRRAQIHEISLRRNEVTDAGVASLAAALCEPGCLIRLLRLNECEDVTDESVEVLCTAVLQSPCLETLDLRATSITSAGKTTLRAAAKQRPSVKLLF